MLQPGRKAGHIRGGPLYKVNRDWPASVVGLTPDLHDSSDSAYQRQEGTFISVAFTKHKSSTLTFLSVDEYRPFLAAAVSPERLAQQQATQTAPVMKHSKQLLQQQPGSVAVADFAGGGFAAWLLPTPPPAPPEYSYKQDKDTNCPCQPWTQSYLSTGCCTHHLALGWLVTMAAQSHLVTSIMNKSGHWGGVYTTEAWAHSDIDVKNWPVLLLCGSHGGLLFQLHRLSCIQKEKEEDQWSCNSSIQFQLITDTEITGMYIIYSMK